MSDTPRGLPLSSSHVEQIFPKLTSEQISRVAVQGHIRAIQPGEVLVEQGDSAVPFFVVSSGEIEIVRPSGAAETLVTIHGPGEFTGEVNMLSGRRTLVKPSYKSWHETLFCAGYTVWSGLRFADPKPHERIAVLGIGGLGHLARSILSSDGIDLFQVL
jgi:Cyclic nucleotide-binding domain